MNCEIPLQLAAGKTYLTVFGTFALALALIAFLYFAGKATTPLKKAALGVAVAANAVIAGFFVWQATGAQLIVKDHTLVLQAGTDRVSVPLSALRWDQAVDASALRFPLRKAGTSLPGMHTVWFRREGGGDAFLLRSSGPSMLIPTTRQFDVVIPTAAYAQLRQCGHAPKAAR